MSQEHFCPVCRAPIKREIRDHLSFKMHVQMTLATATLALVIYIFEGLLAAFSSCFAYLFLWATAEFIHGVKMRQAAKCSVCSFDPILYRRDWRAARKKVEDKLNTVVDEVKAQIHTQMDKEKKQQAKTASAAQPLASLAKDAKISAAPIKTSEIPSRLDQRAPKPVPAANAKAKASSVQKS